VEEQTKGRWPAGLRVVLELSSARLVGRVIDSIQEMVVNLPAASVAAAPKERAITNSGRQSYHPMIQHTRCHAKPKVRKRGLRGKYFKVDAMATSTASGITAGRRREFIPTNPDCLLWVDRSRSLLDCIKAATSLLTQRTQMPRDGVTDTFSTIQQEIVCPIAAVETMFLKPILDTHRP
jgi:hypothetical protein